jgi:hypothetical protein
MTAAQPIQKPYLLLVEGRDEKLFFTALTENLGLFDVEIREVGGKYQFARKLKDITLQSGFAEVLSIGIVRDVDDGIKSTFDSICSALDSRALPKPESVFVPSQTQPRVMILLMPPNNEGTGRMLEDLCLAAMVDDPAMKCVDEYLGCLAGQETKLKENVIAKARIHTFLASREEPDKRLGEAAQAGYWNWDSPVFDTLKDFLRQLAEQA